MVQTMENLNNLNSTTVREICEIPIMKQLRLIAGLDGLDNNIVSVSVYEVADAYKWLKPNQLLISTFSAVPATQYMTIFQEFHRQSVAALILFYSELYYEDIPPLLIELCNQYDIPLFLANTDIAYSEIMTPVMRIIVDKEFKNLKIEIETRDEINQFFLKGAKASDYIAMLHSICQASVILFDKEDEPIAMVGDKTQEKEISDLLKQIRREIRRKLDLGLPEAGFINFPITINNSYNGRLIILTKYSSLSEIARLKVEIVIDGLRRFFVSYYLNDNFRQSIKNEIRNILTKSFINENDIKLLRDYLSVMNIDFTTNIRLLVIDFTDGEGKETGAHLLRSQYRTISESLRYFFNNAFCLDNGGQYIVVIASNTRTIKPMILQFVEDVRKTHGDVAIVISKTIDNVEVFSKAYQEVCDIFKVSQTVLPAVPSVFWSEEYTFYYHLYKLIAGEDPQQLAWAEALLSPVLKSDLQHDKKLFEILKLLLVNDMDLYDVANKLFIHKNTVRYRIETVKKLLDEDPLHKNRFKYTLAVYILLFKNGL